MRQPDDVRPRTEGQAPLGFQWKNRELVQNPSEFPTRARIFALRDEGLSLRRICDTLTSEGHKTRHGGRWHPNTIRTILGEFDQSTHDRRKRNTYLLRTYGITSADYETMHAAQDGLCMTCRNACSTGKVLAVDHDHVNGRVRDLLCARCNRTLGYVDEDAQLLRDLADYVERHGRAA